MGEFLFKGIAHEPTLFQHFNSWEETVSAGWQISNWGPATGANFMDAENTAFETKHKGDHGQGYLSLKTVGVNNLTDVQKKKYYTSAARAGDKVLNSPSPHRNGGEIALPRWDANLTQSGYGYGYY